VTLENIIKPNLSLKLNLLEKCENAFENEKRMTIANSITLDIVTT